MADDRIRALAAENERLAQSQRDSQAQIAALTQSQAEWQAKCTQAMTLLQKQHAILKAHPPPTPEATAAAAANAAAAVAEVEGLKSQLLSAQNDAAARQQEVSAARAAERALQDRLSALETQRQTREAEQQAKLAQLESALRQQASAPATPMNSTEVQTLKAQIADLHQSNLATLQQLQQSQSASLELAAQLEHSNSAQQALQSAQQALQASLQERNTRISELQTQLAAVPAVAPAAGAPAASSDSSSSSSSKTELAGLRIQLRSAESRADKHERAAAALQEQLVALQVATASSGAVTAAVPAPSPDTQPSLELQQKIASLESAVQAAQATLASKSAQYDELQCELMDAVQQQTQTQAENESLRATVVEHETRASTAASSLATSASSAATRIEELSFALAAERSSASAAIARRDQLQADVADARATASTLQASLLAAEQNAAAQSARLQQLEQDLEQERRKPAPPQQLPAPSSSVLDLDTQRRILSLENEVDALRSQVRTSTERANEAETKAKDLTKQAIEQQQQQQSTQSKVDADATAARFKIADLERQLADAKKVAASGAGTAAATTAAPASLQQPGASSSSAEVAALKRMLEDATRQRSEDIARLSMQATAAKQLAADASSKLTAVQQELVDVQATAVRNEQARNEAAAQLATTQARLKDLTAQLGDAQVQSSESGALQQQVVQAKSDAASARQELLELVSQLSDAQQQSTEALSRLDAAQQQATQASAESTQARQTVAELTAQLQQANAALQQKSAAAAAIAASEEKQKDIAKVEAELVALKSALATATSQTLELKDKCDKQSGRLQVLEKFKANVQEKQVQKRMTLMNARQSIMAGKGVDAVAAGDMAKLRELGNVTDPEQRKAMMAQMKMDNRQSMAQFKQHKLAQNEQVIEKMSVILSEVDQLSKGMQEGEAALIEMSQINEELEKELELQGKAAVDSTKYFKQLAVALGNLLKKFENMSLLLVQFGEGKTTGEVLQATLGRELQAVGKALDVVRSDVIKHTSLVERIATALVPTAAASSADGAASSPRLKASLLDQIKNGAKLRIVANAVQEKNKKSRNSVVVLNSLQETLKLAIATHRMDLLEDDDDFFFDDKEWDV
ncbi:hypothetical protein CAOG_00313 [Capsaspora owczarzaki ATCC 30864]|uniref:hypothetical protein n=1 Tax=Capsaspora owczarzaki (strain ATCC 30864) TaxID=595528 RepID=UPI00035210C8|nr:hypothetical protein CAOG_00313 [Capsaspora owczarzaki ATCC 30864]|eukprot:XP_004365184.2 hypothetical protein CAOG_00313 [Capsaspora owczarzaki ATCC 30864]